jgi:hypothetical protein
MKSYATDEPDRLIGLSTAELNQGFPRSDYCILNTHAPGTDCPTNNQRTEKRNQS